MRSNERQKANAVRLTKKEQRKQQHGMVKEALFSVGELWAEFMQNKTKQNKWDMEKSAMFYV